MGELPEELGNQRSLRSPRFYVLVFQGTAMLGRDTYPGCNNHVWNDGRWAVCLERREVYAFV